MKRRRAPNDLQSLVDIGVYGTKVCDASAQGKLPVDRGIGNVRLTAALHRQHGPLIQSIQFPFELRLFFCLGRRQLFSHLFWRITEAADTQLDGSE